MRAWEQGKVWRKVGVKLDELVGATFTLWYGMLLYSMQCNAMCAMLCLAVLWYFWLCLAVLGCTWLCNAILCYNVLFNEMLCYAMLCNAMFSYAEPNLENSSNSINILNTQHKSLFILYTCHCTSMPFDVTKCLLEFQPFNNLKSKQFKIQTF